MSMLTSTSPIPSLHHKEKETHADDDDDDDDDETTPSLSSSSTLLSSGSETKNSTPHHHAIRIFARIRPSPRVNPKVYVDQPTPNEEGAPQLHFHVPKNESQGQINHTKEHFGFRFDRVFDTQVSQEEVFEHVAKDSIDSVLNGFNATIFAYGQTGSGKTFTITGGAERYADRGLIPRSIQYVFKKIKENPSRNFQCFISYLEIYNEIGYDLLDESRDIKKLEDLPKVSLREDEDQHIFIQHLSLRPVVTEEEALNWLFVGDTNKMIAETPSNPSSSRSHCIFMMTLISHTAQGDTQLRSKLHLVDLAGSERVAKTKLDGHLLKEAKFINLSLHYLEQVILALHEKALGKRQHIPYRNSMMTSILRDSLGGNCQTTMIATIATEQHLLEESISTCRFAQRVALISNRVSINEELDPYVLIARLKKQIAELKTQLAIARGEQEVQEDEEGGTKGNELLAGPLSNDQLLQCRQAVKKFMEGDATSLKLISNVSQLQFCFRVFKEFMLVKPELSSSATSFEKSHPSNDDPDEIKYLKKQLQQRDTEIGVLIPMVNKYKEKLKKFETNTENGLSLSFSSSSPHHADELNKPLSSQQNEKNTLWAFPSSSKNSISPMSPSLETLHSKSFERIGHHEWNQAKKWDDASLGPTPSTSMTTTTMRTTPSKKFPSKSLEKMSSLDPSSSTRQHRPTSSIVSMNSPPPSWSLLEEFKNQYQALPLIEEQKEELKLKYIEAKQLGVEANELRNRISMFF